MREPGEHPADEEKAARVLVVDDDVEVGAVLEKGLRVLGYRVLVAADGEAGLEIAHAAQPEVILLDLRMPGIDGHTFLRRLNAAGASAAVVVMSGQGDMQDVIDVLRGGAVDYIRKPCAAVELATAMARAVAARAGNVRLPAVAGGSRPTPLCVPVLDDDPGAEEEHPRAHELPLPQVPPLLATMRALVRRPEVRVDQVLAVLERDPQVAAQVLRVSNTAPYGRGAQAISLRAAVGRIGPRQVHSIVETLYLRDLFRAEDQDIAGLLAQIWRHSVAQATAMRAIAASMRTAHVEPETAYLVGLLADVGASMLLAMMDEGKVGLPEVRLEDYLPAIRANHAEIGAALLARWIRDPAITAAVCEHHPQGTLPASPYGRMLVLAADLIGPDPTAPVPQPQAVVDLCLAELDLDLGRLTALVSGIDEGYRQIVESCA
jgi:CheY-like chemotaxis protein/HD-like signal output (HDOD) protein